MGMTGGKITGAQRVVGRNPHKTIGDLSIACSRSFGLTRPSVICCQITAVGKTLTGILAAGGIRAFGKNYW